jgi:hypothetical protein
MKNYNLTIFQPNKSFDLTTFYDTFSEVSDTEPFMSKIGDTMVLIFGSEVELPDLSMYLRMELEKLCYGFTLLEISASYVAYFPMKTFCDFGLENDDNKIKSKQPILAALNPENLNHRYSVQKGQESLEITDIDTILEKITKSGIKSLTVNETKILNNFSKNN